jgi:Nif-specific regulatory protein
MDRLSQEHEFYRQVLRLGASEEIEPLVEHALEVIVGLTGARQGYLELVDPGDPVDGRWHLAHGCRQQDLDAIREKISRGIISEAMESGRSVSTSSALLDPRFEKRESVKLGQIEAVLCAPIGAHHSIGVLYLQGRDESGPFSDGDVANTEVFAQQLYLLADRLLSQRRDVSVDDYTRDLRARYRLDGVVGRSAALGRALREAMLAASTDVTMLVTGESGTGKTQLARCIHANSARANEPFVELNCAAIPETLAESELFGASKGSHSTATADSQGKIASAGAGTLFLDEIGELPLPTQAKLLQFLQSREYYPLGATASRRSRARIIAATNGDLAEAVRAGRFREDLLFRINAFGVRMPSLGERRDDIPELAESLCRQAAEENGLPVLGLSLNAQTALRNIDLPGNVRQLFNIVSSGTIRAAGSNAAQIQPQHLFPESSEAAAYEDLDFVESTRQFQRDLLIRTLRDTSWNVTEASRRLDLARSHVYNLIKSFGLKREQ